MACLLLVVVLGWIQWAFVRGTTIRHLYSLLTGLGLALYQYGPLGIQAYAVTATVTYAMLLTIPRQWVALPVFFFSCGYLSYVHISRMATDWMGWSQDHSTLIMILTCKLTAFAFNYQDGLEKKEKQPLTEVEKEQAIYAVDQLPNVLEYFSFLAFYSGFLVGPVYEYSDYIRFIKREKEFRDIPCPIFRSLVLVGESILCIVVFLSLFRYFHYSKMILPEWDALPYWYKIVYVNFGMIACKFRYYTGFKLGEAGIVASGFGFVGLREDQQTVNWDRARGAVIRYSEFGKTTKVVIENWNISVTLWLRRYVYNRLALQSVVPLLRYIAQPLTMMMSAFWHGFYPSYYLCFIGFSFLTETSKMVYQTDFSWLPGLLILKPLAWLWQHTCENLNGIVFVQLGLWESVSILNSIYWGPYVGLVVVWLFYKVTGLNRKTRGVRTKKKED